MAIASQVSIAGTPRPRWRPHLSTLVVAALAAALLVILNVPGSPTYRLDYSHGWPWEFATSSDLNPNAARSAGPFRPSLPDRWRWTTQFRTLSHQALLADVAFAAGVIPLVAFLWECRRRRIASAWTLRLSDLFALTLAAALVGGWWVSWENHHAREQGALAKFPQSAHLDVSYVGPRWLAHFAGREHIPRRFFGYWSLYLLVPTVEERHAWPSAMAELRGLQRLDLSGPGVDDRFLADVVRNVDVTELRLFGASVTDKGLAVLADLPRLHVLRIEQMPVGDASIEHLVRLTNLTELRMIETSLTLDGRDRLRQAFPTRTDIR